MKKFILSVFVITFALGSLWSQQTFKTFLPKEGLTTALSQAKTSGLKTPLLSFVATTSQKFEQLPPQFTPVIEMKTGKASMWFYNFRDKDIDTLATTVILMKFSIMGMDQFMPFTLPFGSGGGLPDISTSLDGKNWLQTDSAFASIRRNETYVEFAKANPNHFPLATILFTNPGEEPGMEPNTPYWMTMIAKDTTELGMEPMSCITNAITNETICIDFTSVDENNNVSRVYPNPSRDKFQIEFEKQITQPLNISVISINGVEVMRQTNLPYNGSLIINLSPLPNGEYLLWIHNNEINTLHKIIKQ